jgi:polysaccharide biosynthesis/export protein
MFVMAAAFVWAQDPPKPVEQPRVNTEPAVEGAAAPVDPKVYKIGPEDVVDVQVWREPQLSGRFVVRPDGRITLPLAGELNTDGHTLDEVKEKIVEMYSKYINKPEVTVSLSRVGSKKYYLVGEILRTGMFPLVVPTTVLEAINGAGGFREFANRKKVIILRGKDRLKFNYDDVIKGKNVEQNIFIENGDHIIVQ